MKILESWWIFNRRGGSTPPPLFCLIFSFLIFFTFCKSNDTPPPSSYEWVEKRTVDDYEIFHDLSEWQGEGILAVKEVVEGEKLRKQVVMLSPDGSKEMLLFQAKEPGDLNAIGGLGLNKENKFIIFGSKEKENVISNLWRFKNNKIEIDQGRN